MKSEKEKMLAGEPFKPWVAELDKDRAFLQPRLHRLNTERGGVPLRENEDLLAEILPNCPRGTLVRPPFYCDYGYNISCGERVFINYNCTILDVGKVRIGSNVLIGPGVQIYAVTHPIDADERRTGVEWGEDVTIGDDCWIGGCAVICPGVTIGNRCVIAAGAVVTKDLPDDVMAAGVPARIVKRLR